MKRSLAHLPELEQDESGIGARYDREYEITKEQLEQLAPCVKKLHEVTEKICVAKIESFGV